MTDKSSNVVLLLILAGIIVGVALGYFLPGVMLATAFIGGLFLSALQLVAIPLAAAAIIAAIGSMSQVRQVGRPLAAAFIYFLGTSVIAAGIGIVLSLVLQPGWGANAANAVTPRAVFDMTGVGISDFLMPLVPTSFPGAFVEGHYLGIIIFSFLFGGILATLGRQGKVVQDIVIVVRDILIRLVYLLLYAAPIGLLSVVGVAIALNPQSLPRLSGDLAYYVLAVGGGMLLLLVIVLPLVLWLVTKRSPLTYFVNLVPALGTALATGSSVAAFPATYTGVVEKNKVDSRAGAIALPLGMVLNLNGMALGLVVGAFFVAQVFGMSLSAVQILIVAATAVLVSFGSASIPHAGILLLVVVLRAAGFPPEAYTAIGLIVLVDWLLSRFRAVINVWGDAVGAAVTASIMAPPKAVRKSPVRSPSRKAPAARSDTRRTQPTPQRSHSGSFDRRDRPPRGRSSDTRDSERSRHQRPSDRGEQRRPGGSRPQSPAKREQRPSAPVRNGAAAGSTSDRDKKTSPTPIAGNHQPSPAVAEQPPRFSSSEVTGLPADISPNNHSDTRDRNSKVDDHAPDTTATQEPVAMSVDKEADSPAESPTPKFGRLKARRGRAVKNSSDPTTTSEDSSSDNGVREEFSSEDITFGRQKKKRTR
ncbi:MAG: cation:dicarboxylase symporter family transporter [bacterium]